MVDYLIHRFRFGDWKPSSIKALAVDQFSNQLAVGRYDGEIEIINPSEKWHRLVSVPGQTDFSLQGLTWSKQSEGVSAHRLFGISVRGFVFEVNLTEQSISEPRDTHGGPAWCMSASPRNPHIAVGCEDGAVRLFQFDGPNLEFHRSFPTTGHRILSVAHHPSLPRLFAGCSDGTIRCFDESTYRSLFRMSGDITRGSSTLILCLLVLKDSTVISGDNKGHVQVWDGATGVLSVTFHQHSAEVLALASSPDEDQIFASGTDPKVTCLRKVYNCRDEDGRIVVNEASGLCRTRSGSISGPSSDMGLGHQWIYTKSHRPHSHDVFALAVVRGDSNEDLAELDSPPEKSPRKRSLNSGSKSPLPYLKDGHLLLSGGLDTKLCLYSVPRFSSLRSSFLLPIPSSGLIEAPICPSPHQDLMFMKQRSSIDVWASPALLPLSTPSTPEDQSPLPQLLLRIALKGGSSIHSLCCSPSGDILLASSVEGTKAWYLHRPSPDSLIPVKISLPSKISSSLAQCMRFSTDGRRVALYLGKSKKLFLLDVSSSPGEIEGEAESAHCPYKFSLVFTLDHGENVVQDSADLARFNVGSAALDSSVRDMSFSCDGQYLALSSPTRSLFIYDLDAMRIHWKAPALPASITCIQFSPFPLALPSTHQYVPKKVSNSKSKSKPQSEQVPVQTSTSQLFTLLADNSLMIFDTESRSLSPLSFPHPSFNHASLVPLSTASNVSIPPQIRNLPSPLCGLSFSSPASSSQRVFLHGQNTIVSVALHNSPLASSSSHISHTCPVRLSDGDRPSTTPTTTPPSKKGRKENSETLSNSTQPSSPQFSVIDAYRSIIHMRSMEVADSTNSFLVVVENPWLRVVDSLPDTLFKKKYAT